MTGYQKTTVTTEDGRDTTIMESRHTDINDATITDATIYALDFSDGIVHIIKTKVSDDHPNDADFLEAILAKHGLDHDEVQRMVTYSEAEVIEHEE